MKPASIAIIFFLIFNTILVFSADKDPKTHLSVVGPGWSKNSVNATIFRKNSVISSNGQQFVAYYDSTGSVVLAKRKLGSDQWERSTTQYKGNVNDAHNIISIMVDGEGYLHMSWDHHNNPLHYCRSLQPYGLEMGEMEPMTGLHEKVVSYPEFYRFSNGDLLFAFRDGGSGNGNLVLNRYEVKSRKWKQLQTNLIDGQQQRNAYWQLVVDGAGTIHVTWVWRETPNVATNHDLCYACSKDGGITWENSEGTVYSLPITINNAEVIYPIGQNSNLINQTSMTVDKAGNPYIATYFKKDQDTCTQFYVVYRQQDHWTASAATSRTLDFSLGGVGSRSIPISRPQLVVKEDKAGKELIMIYRDEEEHNQICLAIAPLNDNLKWNHFVIPDWIVERWEPSFDTELWRTSQLLHLYMQRVQQGQAETSVDLPAQNVNILELSF